MSNQPKPDSKEYSDLISEIKKGKIKIPKFQRDFIWSLEKTAQLLDSILKGYPIGTFILWETEEQLNGIKNIGDFKLPTLENEIIQYVLDGQQRITSLFAVYLGEKIQKTDYKNIYINLEIDIDNSDEQIIVTEKPEEGEYITLYELLDSDLKKFLKLTGKSQKSEKILTYKVLFTNYQFSVVILRKNDIESAIEVFTRINTGGQVLTLFQIMVAKTYDEKEKFDMQERWEQWVDKLREKNKYDTISSIIVLHILSLILSPNKECKRSVILKLKKEQIIEKWEEVITALETSIEFFYSSYGIKASKILPYDSLLVPFAYFFHKQKNSPNQKQYKLLEEFFWRVSLSYRYSNATDSKLAQDIKRIDKVLKNERPEYNDIKIDIAEQSLIDGNFSAGSSYCKAIICLLASRKPKNFDNTGEVILDNAFLRVANSRNYHHFFPKAYLKKRNIKNENSLMNITLVGDHLNKMAIRTKAPSIYISEFKEKYGEQTENLKTHFIGDLEKFGINKDNYELFLKKRAKMIHNELKKKIEFEL
jgi:hypothetical protein